MELATGYPGYHSLMPKSCGTFAEVLKQNGWNTGWYGKNHNVPDWHSSQAGPFDLWPTGLVLLCPPLCSLVTSWPITFFQ